MVGLRGMRVGCASWVWPNSQWVLGRIGALVSYDSVVPTTSVIWELGWGSPENSRATGSLSFLDLTIFHSCAKVTAPSSLSL